MHLLYRRPLACICLCFLCALYGVQFLNPTAKMIAMALLCPIAVIFFLLFAIRKKHRIVLLTLFLCAVSLLFGILYAYVRIDWPQAEAQERTGKRSAVLQVISCEYRNDFSSQYIAELVRIDEDDVSIRSYLICGFESDLQPGDQIFGNVELMETDQMTYGVVPADACSDSRVLLTTVLHDAEDGIGIHRGADDSFFERLMGRNGIEMLSADLRESISSFFDHALGKEISPLSRGFFMGDTSDIAPEQIRDFRRAGLSHLLAVSGLHISVLLGAIELLLRKLTVTKKVRMVSVSVCAVLLLMLTGFSMSACRSVAMLLMTYLIFMMAEDGDSFTSLLISICIILLISPHSVLDLGLWMSFFATLGLIVIFPLIEEKLPYRVCKNKILHLLWRILRALCVLVCMTLICNLFLLPIMWSVFREMSLVTVFANLVVSPLGTLFLCQIPIVLLLSGIPGVGQAVLFVLTLTGGAMTEVATFFSSMDWAVLSLRYVFADIIIPILSLVMLIFLLIRLRRKWLMILPPVVAVVAFCICLFVTYANEAPQVSYLREGNDRLVCISDDGKAVMCDVSCDDVNTYFDAANVTKECGATYIDVLALGHLSPKHDQMLREFLPYVAVGEIWFPKHAENERLLDEIARTAAELGVTVRVYESGSVWSVLKDTTICLEEGAEDNSVALCRVQSREESMCYLDLSVSDSIHQSRLTEMAKNSDVVLISSAGERFAEYDLTGAKVQKIFFDEEPECMPLRVRCGEIPSFIYREKAQNRTFLLTSK